MIAGRGPLEAPEKRQPAQTTWALAWVDGALVAPLALLVQGAPAEPFSL